MTVISDAANILLTNEDFFLLLEENERLQSELEDYKARYLSAEANITNLASQVISRDEENQRLRKTLIDIKREVNDDLELGYHRWVSQACEIVLEPPKDK